MVALEDIDGRSGYADGGTDVRIGGDDWDTRSPAGEGDRDGETVFEHMSDWQFIEPLAGNVEFLQYAYAAAHDGVERSTQHVVPPVPPPGFCEDAGEDANRRYASNPNSLIVYLSVFSFHMKIRFE